MYTQLISFSLVIYTLLFSHSTLAQQGHLNINAGATFDQGHIPLAASAEYFVSDAFSVGLQGYRSQETTTINSVVNGLSSSSKYVSTFIGLRGNIHLSSLLPEEYRRIDPYVGVSVGKVMLNGKVDLNLGSFGGQTSTQESRTYNGITIYAPIGVRYLIKERFSTFVEYNLGLANTTADIDQSGTLDNFYEKRQYQFGAGLSFRF